jgi:hypothetical protein
MSKELVWGSAIEQLYRAIGITDLISEAELVAGMRQLEGALLAIAVEVNLASTRGESLREAVRNEESYPHLHRAHAAISDILEMSVPLEIEVWVRRVHAMPTPPIVDKLRTSLARAAIGVASPEACTARFILFQSTRATLKIAAWRTDGAFEAVGATDDEIDEIAEEQVDQLLSLVPELPEDIRPFHVLMASAMCDLTATVDELRRLLHEMGRDIVEGFLERAAVERNLRDVDAVDATLIKNALGPHLGNQYLSIEELQRAHPVLLAPHSRNGLDKRSSRLRERLERRAEGLPPRKRPSLYQVLTDIEGDAP